MLNPWPVDDYNPNVNPEDDLHRDSLIAEVDDRDPGFLPWFVETIFKPEPKCKPAEWGDIDDECPF